LQEFGTVADMQHLLELPTFNTLAIAQKMKATIKKSDPAAHVCCKLVLLYLDALEYLGTELTPAVISAAYVAAHAADFDATMTRVVFQTILKVQKRSKIGAQKGRILTPNQHRNKRKSSLNA
jgi:hypothetical protein